MPLVSVIIPVYKTEAYLPRCIDSLLAQTLQDLEVILVDDGSPDGSGKICDDYAARYPSIRAIHKENGGPQLARLAGMCAAKGKYLAFVDSDDWVLPEMFAPMVQQAEEQQADMVAVGFIRDYGSRLEPYSNEVPSGVYRDEQLAWLRENAVFSTNAMIQALAPCVWNKLFRRDTMLEVLLGCKDKLTFGEDALHTFAALFASRCVVVMNEHQQYRYQLREGSTTNSYYKNYMSDLYTVYDRMTLLAAPVKTDALTVTIAYNYIFLYLGGISQEMGKGNPAGFVQKYRHIRAIAKNNRLKKCLPLVNLQKYPRRSARYLQLLAAGRYNSFFVFWQLCRVWDKAKRLRKKVFR